MDRYAKSERAHQNDGKHIDDGDQEIGDGLAQHQLNGADGCHQDLFDSAYLALTNDC